MSFSAEILSVGTELLLGNTTNTDARDLSLRLSALGINVYHHTVVGDNPERLKKAVELARSRADIIITTGGLGPTCDDLTKQTLAECFGLKLEYHEDEAQFIREYFSTRLHAHAMTENNLQQAYLPEGCVKFRNTCGTAPGCAFYKDGTHVVMLPGPPRECLTMFDVSAEKYLRTLSDCEIRSHIVHVFGVGESWVESKLRPLMLSLENPTLAPYAREGEMMLRVTARAKTDEEADALMSPVIDKIRDTLGDLIYGIDTVTLENTVLGMLKARGMTLACAESCTGGLIAKRLTDVPGASRAFLGGAVTYSNSAKTGILGVPAELIAEKFPVSREVAEKMAEGARLRFGADIAVSVTGIAGPDSDESGLPVGTAFIGLAAEDGVWCRHVKAGTDRERMRIICASHALDMVRRYLTGLDMELKTV